MPLLDINANKIRSAYLNLNDDARSIVHNLKYSRCLFEKIILFFVSTCFSLRKNKTKEDVIGLAQAFLSRQILID